MRWTWLCRVAWGTGPGTAELVGAGSGQSLTAGLDGDGAPAEGPVPVNIQKIFADTWPPCFLPCEARHRAIPEASFSARKEGKRFLPSPPALT